LILRIKLINPTIIKLYGDPGFPRSAAKRGEGARGDRDELSRAGYRKLHFET